MRNRYGQAFRLRLAARVYQANADQGGRYDCLRFATHAARLSIDAWKEAAACLEDQGHKVSFTRWGEFLRDMRVAFDVEDEDKRWPDMIAIADGLAEKHLWIAPYMDAAMILKEHRHSYDVLMREKARRPGDAMIRTRYDLIAIAARRTSEQLAKDVSPKGQENRYFFLAPRAPGQSRAPSDLRQDARDVPPRDQGRPEEGAGFPPGDSRDLPERDARGRGRCAAHEGRHGADRRGLPLLSRNAAGPTWVSRSPARSAGSRK